MRSSRALVSGVRAANRTGKGVGQHDDRQNGEEVHDEGQQESLAPRDGAVDVLDIRLPIVEVEVHQELIRL